MSVFNNHRWPSQGVPALAVVVCLFVVVLPARMRGEPIVFSQPTDGGFATNLYSLIAPEESRTIRDKLQERQLSAAQLIKPHAIMDPGFGPPPPRRMVMPNKEQRDKLDKDKNWAFSLQEDIDKRDPTAEEALKFIDPKGMSKPRTADTAEERYVARLADGAEAGNPKANGASKTEYGEEASAAKDESVATQQRSAAGSVLRSLLESGGTKGGLSRLGRDDTTLDRASSESFATPTSQSSRMSDFRALLEGKSTLSSALDQGPSSPARITGIPGLSASGGSPMAASGFTAPGNPNWTKPLSSGLTPLPSLAPAPSALPLAPPPLSHPSPLRMMGLPPPAFPPRR